MDEQKIYLTMKDSIIDYLTEELKINSDALKAYNSPIQQPDTSNEVQRIREIEAIKLRDRNQELTRHIAVIKRMFPSKK